eukprot:TRINITY_DN7547_c0_g1_i1.p1 TRINITY_DN7547_c0_g1~~TRINITY_DN7547_c0_g1_i1.p1  ORF type:complete len:478 (-),score=98.83 TRINITY_DN7547_c0_g1_i1:660-2006(-)
MGQKKAARSAGAPAASPELFADAVRKQMRDKQRLVRAFDVGGGGVKTGLFAATALRELLVEDSVGAAGGPEQEAAAQGGPVEDPDELPQLQWIESPQQLGIAPGDDGFSSWLLEALPRLRREIADPHVCFGVSIGGDVDHKTATIEDWWPGGGYPCTWDDGRASPRLAELMGLPSERTFVIHDGEAHLLGCGRSLLPPPFCACLAIGTGLGHGFASADGAMVDPCCPEGVRTHCLNGIPLSGARYNGIWQRWLNKPDAHSELAEEVMAKEFANMARPWHMPWTSLVLGRRGIELAEAVHGLPPPPEDEAAAAEESGAMVDRRAVATQAYGEQWRHFLNTQFVPQFCAGSRRHPVQQLCLAGGIADRNWAILREVLVEPGTNLLMPMPEEAVAEREKGAKRGRAAKQAAAGPASRVRILSPAPRGSGLIGAGMYALAGMGGAAMAIWTS